MTPSNPSTPEPALRPLIALEGVSVQFGPQRVLQAIDLSVRRGQTLAVDVDRQRTAFMPVKAGQFSLHHTHLVHNSRPNRSNDRRIGLGISYISTWARCTARDRVTAMLVRGEDKYGNFDDERRPVAEAGPAERAFHAEAVARFRAMNAVESDENKIAVVKR